MRRVLGDLLEENRALWRLTLGDCAPEYVVRNDGFDSLEAAVAAAPTLEAARAAVRAWNDEHRRKSVAEVVGPIAAACERQAERRGKRARFVLEGADVMLAAREWALGPSIAHAVRNAIDHGIEPPEERGEKDPCGEVRVRFEEDAGTVRCVISDDGRGVDRARLAEKAVQTGLLSADRAASLCLAAQLDLVFADGLSSSDEITDTSGRGVGMGALRAAVEELGGRISVSSEPGRGTTLELRWPRGSTRHAAPRRSERARDPEHPAA
jgi:two-component system chemotaxis sensor kinase CheA